MTDDRALKEVWFNVYEESSYKVIYQVVNEKYEMYVWAEDSDEAKRKFLKREKKATILTVELGRPERRSV